MKTSIEAPRTKAETETQIVQRLQMRRVGDTRRGIPIRPSAKSGAKVELKAMNIDQKWIFAEALR